MNQQLLAERLGISRTTVSRCFTNHPGINPVTRAKVFKLAAQLGYQHMEMRAPTKPRRAKVFTVGVLICTEIEEYLRADYQSPGVQLSAGVSEFAQLNEIRLEVHYTAPGEATVDGPSYRKLDALERRAWDGIILIYPFPRDVVDDLQLRFPVVSLVEQPGGAALNCVDVDHTQGIDTIVNRLVTLGHREIGFYTRRYVPEALWSLRRFSAYFEKLTRSGFRFVPENVVGAYDQAGLSVEESFAAVERRVRQGVKAWVCAADHQAYDLIAALKTRGLRVPEDVSVTGFDGIEKPDWAPLLTTAIIPYREIGFTGGKRLQELMRKRFGSPQHILVASRLREGETVGRRGP